LAAAVRRRGRARTVAAEPGMAADARRALALFAGLTLREGEDCFETHKLLMMDLAFPVEAFARGR